jgi:hypothetical protein
VAKNTRKMEIVIGARNKTKGVFRKIKAGFKSLIGIGARVGAGIAAGLGVAVGALTAITAKVLESADGLAKTSDKMGVTTEELSALRHAAQLAGMDIKEMDKSLQFMQRNMAEAADGMSTQADAFEKLGLSAEKLQTVNPGDAMQEIIRALAGVENQSEKVQIAMDIFGRSGASMLNLTADGLEKARKEAELFGIAMSRADAKQMENINDSMTRIKGAIQGAAITLVKQFAPTIEAVGKRFVAWSSSGQLTEWAKELGHWLVNIIPKALLLILDIMAKVSTGFRGWQMLWNELKIGFYSFAESLWNGLNTIRNGVTSFLEAININGIFDDAVSESKRIAEEQRTIIGQLRRDKSEALKDQNETIKTNKDEQKSIEAMRLEIERFTKAIQDGSIAAKSEAEAAEAIASGYTKAATAKQKFSNVGGQPLESGDVAAENRRLYFSERTEGS